jgi:hypothetical protein
MNNALLRVTRNEDVYSKETQNNASQDIHESRNGSVHAKR